LESKYYDKVDVKTVWQDLAFASQISK
jgi:hypothetical protein